MFVFSSIHVTSNWAHVDNQGYNKEGTLLKLKKQAQIWGRTHAKKQAKN